MKGEGRGDPARTVLFVCPHGAGKSRMAAAFFNRVAPHGWHATTAGQEPDAEDSPNAVRLLAGTDAEQFLDREPPQAITAVAAPALTVAIDCDVPGAEHWELQAREMNEALRDELRARVEALAQEIDQQGEGRSGARRPHGEG